MNKCTCNFMVTFIVLNIYYMTDSKALGEGKNHNPKTYQVNTITNHKASS